MYGWEALDLRNGLALKFHCYSISAQSYEFYLHLAHVDNLDITLSLIQNLIGMELAQTESSAMLEKGHYHEMLLSLSFAWPITWGISGFLAM